LAELMAGRKVAADVPVADTQLVGDRLRLMRRAMTLYERACYRLLGQIVTHAVEATCRTAQPRETERELAGHVSQRLLRRGAIPIAIAVTADGRLRTYRRHAFTSAPIQQTATISVTARKYGLHATATRTVSFGPIDDQLKQEHLTACRVHATYAAASWPDAVIKNLLAAGKRVYEVLKFEHEWQCAPQGHVTGRLPVEKALFPEDPELFAANWVAAWTPTVGAAACGDTYLVSENGPRLVTPVEGDWPLVRVRVSGIEILCPHVLEQRLGMTSDQPPSANDQGPPSNGQRMTNTQ
jgi:Xaa-Pro aminopeptidase